MKQFKHPSSICLTGMSFSGKTVIALKILENIKYLFVGNPIKKIIYCCGSKMKPDFSKITLPLEFVHGMPTEEHFEHRDSVIVLDDLMESISGQKSATLMATQIAHHHGITFIYLLQNIFEKNLRTLSINCHAFIFTKYTRSKDQLQVFFRQIAPKEWRDYMEFYEMVCKRKDWPYILVDVSAWGRDNFRLRTDIFPDDEKVLVLGNQFNVSKDNRE